MTKCKKNKSGNYCVGGGKTLIDGREIGNTRKKLFWADGVLYFQLFADDIQPRLFALLTDTKRTHEIDFVSQMASGNFPGLSFTGIVQSKEMKLHGSDWLGLRMVFRVEGNALNSFGWK